MKLVTWNVNSLNVRLPRLLGWLAVNTPDVVCLQETKLEDAKFPHIDIEAAGYKAHVVRPAHVQRRRDPGSRRARRGERDDGRYPSSRTRSD